MEKQNILQNVQRRMKEMQDNKTAQLVTIRQKQQEARSKIEVADLGMKQATEEMNIDAYEKAKNAKHKAQTALEMYNERYSQIKQQEYISEAESDSVIDSLLEYEKILAEDLKTAAAEPLKALSKLHEEYMAAVNDTEKTLTAWQRDIHANYSTRGLTTRIDPLTGNKTDRSETPIPVHAQRYEGCREAIQMGNYLEKAKELYKE